MTPDPVSVIVVSRGRPQLLQRCLTGVAQLWYDNFEIVVVADPEGIEAARAAGFGDSAKLVPFGEANISAARNLGLAHAAGKLVAFIDDDAVPEPTWLDRLTAPFADELVAAAGGFVRGRNGVSFQWRARVVDRLGRDADLAMEENAARVFDPEPGKAIKTEGTNCAFRRDVLARMGGFDPAFHYYLDEADLNLRLAATGAKTAIVPGAQVHHGYAASEYRAADRVPLDLSEIGASLTVFLRKHTREEDSISARVAEVIAAERRRALRHMVDGRLEPGGVDELMKTLRFGLTEGALRDVAPLKKIGKPKAPFRRFDRKPGEAKRLAGRTWQARRLRAEAAALASQGHVVSLFLFSPTALYHRVRFRGGVWEQTGGFFGRSERDQPAFQWAGFASRLTREWARVADLRCKSGQDAATKP